MYNSVAQYPVLWLLMALLLGVFLEWLLEMFYFRRPLADARNAARRRGEELDSERFAHGRCQADLKAKLAELDTAQKGRALAESLLTAARGKLGVLEGQLGDLSNRHLTVQAALATREIEAASLAAERDSLTREVLDLRLVREVQEAALATETGAVHELRSRLASLTDSQEDLLRHQATLEAKVSDLTVRRENLEVALASRETQVASLSVERDSLTREVLDLRLVREVQEAALATEVGAAQELRTEMTSLKTAHETAQKRLAHLEELSSQQATKGQALESDLQAAMRRHADAESALVELRGALVMTQEELADARKLRVRLEEDHLATRTALEKVEMQLADAKMGSASVEHRLKARIDEVKQLSDQLGEAAEELAELKAKAAQLEANLEASQSTRKALEKELADLTVRVSTPVSGVDLSELVALRELLDEQERMKSALELGIEELRTELKIRVEAVGRVESRLAESEAARQELEARLAESERRRAEAPPADRLQELAQVREELREQERRTASWEVKAQELEAELLATSRANENLGKELERLRESTPASGPDEALALELETMTRERNEIAAELAALKAAGNR